MAKSDVSRIAPLKALIEKDPDNALSHYMLANEYLKAEQNQSALDELEIYFRMADDEGAGYRMAATALLALGRKDEAKEAYRRGAEAARRHIHEGMAAEFEAALEELL